MNGFDQKRLQTLERALAVIGTKGGVCLDPRFEASSNRIEVRCGSGHQWAVSPYKLLEGDWCRPCARETAARRKREETFEHFQLHVRGFGGQVDATSYDFGGQLLPIICGQGHRILVNPVDVLYRRTRCRKCADAERRAGLEEKQADRSKVSDFVEQTRRDKIRLAAEAHGGSVLPNQQAADRSHTWVRCEKHGHDSLVRNHRILTGQWCSLCGIETRATTRRQKTFQKAKQYATSKGGLLVSTSYPVGADTLEWECSHGHRWHASPSTVINGGTWCPEEADRSPKTMTAVERQRRAAQSRRAHSLVVAKRRALARGGECLTQEYLASDDGMMFRCGRGHEFTMSYRDLKTHWCAACSRTRSSRGEILCRAILERLLGFSLKSGRPTWLKSSKGRGLSLDMYNGDHRLALEYQGDGVHSGFRASSWYDDPVKFARTLELDDEKATGCRENGVKLIPIPGLRETISLAEVIDILKGLLRANDVAFDELAEVSVNHDELFWDDLLERVHEVMVAKGGTLVSTLVPGMLHPIDVRCTRHGLTWATTASRLIHKGRWCPECSKEHRRAEPKLPRDSHSQ